MHDAVLTCPCWTMQTGIDSIANRTCSSSSAKPQPTTDNEKKREKWRPDSSRRRSIGSKKNYYGRRLAALALLTVAVQGLAPSGENFLGSKEHFQIGGLTLSEALLESPPLRRQPFRLPSTLHVRFGSPHQRHVTSSTRDFVCITSLLLSADHSAALHRQTPFSMRCFPRSSHSRVPREDRIRKHPSQNMVAALLPRNTGRNGRWVSSPSIALLSELGYYPSISTFANQYSCDQRRQSSQPSLSCRATSGSLNDSSMSSPHYPPNTPSCSSNSVQLPSFSAASPRRSTTAVPSRDPENFISALLSVLQLAQRSSSPPSALSASSMQASKSMSRVASFFTELLASQELRELIHLLHEISLDPGGSYSRRSVSSARHHQQAANAVTADQDRSERLPSAKAEALKKQLEELQEKLLRKFVNSPAYAALLELLQDQEKLEETRQQLVEIAESSPQLKDTLRQMGLAESLTTPQNWQAAVGDQKRHLQQLSEKYKTRYQVTSHE